MERQHSEGTKRTGIDFDQDDLPNDVAAGGQEVVGH